MSNGFIDVRDLATAHVLSGQKVEAGGERIIVSSSMSCRSSILLVAHDVIGYS